MSERVWGDWGVELQEPWSYGGCTDVSQPAMVKSLLRNPESVNHIPATKWFFYAEMSGG